MVAIWPLRPRTTLCCVQCHLEGRFDTLDQGKVVSHPRLSPSLHLFPHSFTSHPTHPPFFLLYHCPFRYNKLPSMWTPSSPKPKWGVTKGALFRAKAHMLIHVKLWIDMLHLNSSSYSFSSSLLLLILPPYSIYPSSSISSSLLYHHPLFPPSTNSSTSSFHLILPPTSTPHYITCS